MLTVDTAVLGRRERDVRRGFSLPPSIGPRTFVDGARVFARDEGRPQRDDDDLVALDLTAGDHTLVLGLHQHMGAWSFRVRLLDAELQPPRGAAWTLPGTTPENSANNATEGDELTR